MSKRKANKKVKQMICDSLNNEEGINKSFMHVWLDGPCLVCFTSANFMWREFGVVSIKGCDL